MAVGAAGQGPGRAGVPAAGRQAARPHEGVVDHLGRLMEGGFDIFKLHGTEALAMLDLPRAVDTAVAKIVAVHEALGTQVNFGLDFHGRAAAQLAKRLLRGLGHFKPLFVKERVLAEQAKHYARLAAAVSSPLARGRAQYSGFDCERVLQYGGITGCHKMAAMAGRRGGVCAGLSAGPDRAGVLSAGQLHGL